MSIGGATRAGGNMEHDWPLAQALKTGDEAIGVPVLIELYDRMKATTITPDLSAMWLDWVLSLPATQSSSIKARRKHQSCDRSCRHAQARAEHA
jgi:hypothetical protein